MKICLETKKQVVSGNINMNCGYYPGNTQIWRLIRKFGHILRSFSWKSGYNFEFLGVPIVKKDIFLKIFQYFMILCLNLVSIQWKTTISMTKSFIFYFILWLCIFCVILVFKICFFDFLSEILVNVWKVNDCWRNGMEWFIVI